MWFVGCLFTLVVGVVVSHSDSTFPNCTSVNTKTVQLEKYAESSPYYLLETSTSTVFGINVSTIDSVCYSLVSCGSDLADAQAIVTLTNDSTSITTATFTEVEAGIFFVNSTSSPPHYRFYLGKPCSGTYVVYQCTPDEDYSDDETMVVVVSTQRSVSDRCLQKAESLALRTFPNLTFTALPNTAQTPCFCGCSG